MRILINALFLIPNRVGGSETYLRGLVAGLSAVDQDNEYILCLGPEAATTFRLDPGRWQVLRSPAASGQRALRLTLEQVWLPRAAARAGATLIHSAGYSAPLVSRPARITSILDMNYKRHPEDLSALERLVYATLIPRVARTSHHIVTSTEASRADIVRWTAVPATRVSVVPYAPRETWPGDPREDAARLAAAGIREPFMLSVAASYPHKNLERLVHATDVDGQHIELAIVGLRGRAHQSLQRAIHGRSSIKILGWVDDALLASLYRRAQALAFPSLYEGFGLPIIEAMALGTPVITSNLGAMAEVAGGAALLVDPYDVDAIRQALQAVSTDADLRARLRTLGRQRAAEFSWQRTASLTRELYAQAARQRRARP